jgi:DNA-binding NtrC family response regulator
MTLVIEHLLMGSSRAMVELRRAITRIAPSMIPVLIEGETGTGKELVATSLHALSGRTGAFVPVNMAAIAEPLFESQVFGHRRGAFSGAVTDQQGFVEEAAEGTLFLDEIAATPLSGQAKLLRALESRKIRPLGAKGERSVNFRVVAASNVSLDDEVQAKRFRNDLLYRLCGDKLIVPPLRERAEDISEIARHYARLASVERGSPVSIGTSGIRELSAHPWTGNVRQLRSVVERAVFGADRSVLEAADFGVVIERLGRRLTPVSPLTGEAKQLLDRLEAACWDTVIVAQQLGVSRKTVYVRMAKFGLSMPSRFKRDVRLLAEPSPTPARVDDESRHASALCVPASGSLTDEANDRRKAPDSASMPLGPRLQQAS